MNQTSVSDDPRRSPASVGLGVLAVLMLGVTAWLYSQRSAVSPAATGHTPPLEAMPTDLPGFRPDAWFLPDDARLGFVEIPAGSFLMGGDSTTDPQAFANERWSGASAQGVVDLPVFHIGRYEVTVAQFAAFVAAAGYAVGDQTLQRPPNHPVANVSWPDALAYCRWLDVTLRAAPATPPELRRLLRSGSRVTLPTEAQWEKAARGPDGRIYPWGREPGQNRANYQGQGTVSVGSHPCADCPYGLLDMSGNVWEWTRSPYQPYPFNPADDREGLEADALWVMRGGSFTDPERNVRTTTRGGGDPGVRRPFMGFRVAISGSGS